MEIQIHNTTKIVTINGVPARVWEGCTASGIGVVTFITRIAVALEDDQSEFMAELEAATTPSAEVEAISLRLLI